MAKRRRIGGLHFGEDADKIDFYGKSGRDENSNAHLNPIHLTTGSKQAGNTVAPFLAKHIPKQHTPAGPRAATRQKQIDGSATKFCYRHTPDLKCRRQANEPSMDQLQRELSNLGRADQEAIAHTWSIFSASPAKQRHLILQGILTQCCFSQLSFLAAQVRELVRIDFLSMLPAEISFRVLCYLDTSSLCKAARVSRRWRTLADDDVVWHRMCEQHIDRKCMKCGWGLPLLERKQLRASKREMQLRATSKGFNEWSPNPGLETKDTAGSNDPDAGQSSFIDDSTDTLGRCTENASVTSPESQRNRKTRPWKDVYRDRFMVGTNWKYGRCKIKILRGHTNGVMCLQFDDQILASGSYDTTIKIWDMHSGDEIRTLRGHTSAVRCLQFDDTKLISGGLDCKIKVWNWRTGECLSTLSGHSAGVIGLHFDSSILASGSVDGTVRIWNFDDKSAWILRGHTDWVNAVRIDSASRTVFSASDDGTIKLWDLDRRTCIKTLEGHVGQVQQIVLLPHDFEFEESEATDADHDGACSTASSSPSISSDVHLDADPYGSHFQHSAGDSYGLRRNMDDSQGLMISGALSTPASTSTSTISPNPTVESFNDFTSRTNAQSSGTARPRPPRYILSSALDSTIRLWDTISGKPLRTYFGHVEGVWALAADSLRVVSGAQDRTVKVWDSKGRCERTFIGHMAPVTCISLSDEHMCSGGEDCEIRIYSF